MGEVEPAEPELKGRQRRAFSLAQRAARRIVRRRFRLLRLVKHAYFKLRKHDSAVDQVKDDLHVMLRLVRAWATRRYRAVPWKSMVYAAAAIIYFVNPADLIPDVLVGFGFLDDAAIVAAVVRAIAADLERFRGWEREGSGEAAVTAPSPVEGTP